ncbi:hypothetical protein F4781DRAFT_388013 [Annulohypoxylon bovei var. microspora]|nr:hypothetical protein F4781DRAFT_388013 [Annulohypoxylon bovei var. microspora]
MSQQPTAPMLINVPPPASNPDTPSDMPGTPTSTTTSLSALSTTAIKDGHRGHSLHGLGGPRHQHHSSTNSLEAERADRISRLAGLERVSTLRAPNQNQQGGNANATQTTPTATAAQQAAAAAAGLTPAFFDSNGQPTAITKMSTVGTASATGSVGARTTTEAGQFAEADMDADLTEVDEDGMSMDTNYRTMDVDSTSGPIDPMDEDISSRSAGGYEDRMSDDGTASLVAFGEGANSTVSGPIYHRRPLPGTAGATGVWALERSSSGLSQEMNRSRDTRDIGNDTPVSATAAAETRQAKYVDGVAADGGGHVGTSDDDVFVDTTTRGPVPVQPGQPRTSALREGVGGPASREAAERIVRERLDSGENARAPVLGNSSTKDGDKLGKFYFEEKK